MNDDRKLIGYKMELVYIGDQNKLTKKEDYSEH